MTNIFEQLRDWLLQPLMGQIYVDRRADIKKRRDYRQGKQAMPLKSADDSFIVNFIGLIVERSVSMLFGKEIAFDLPGESDSLEQIYIDAVWRVNRKQRLLKSVATYGAEAGTCYVKLLPDGIVDFDGNLVPRLVALDPASVQMDALPEDNETVIRYIIAYTIHDPATDRDIAKKQVIEQEMLENKDGIRRWANQDVYADHYWMIRDYHADDSNRWILDNEQSWEWDFPPLVHWKNLPENGTSYGRPDITDDLIDLQDKFNFVVSNTAKIIKFHAHPKIWGKMFSKAQEATWGVDDMLLSNSDNAQLSSLEMQSDLGSSLNFIRFLRQALFDIARSVDIDSLADKLGALTNFALRVLYQDAMSKLEDKRGSYGEALVEINHALLELAGMADTDGGEIVWPDVLPVNEAEQSAALKTDLELGLISKQTAAGERGYNWENEEERIAAEKQAGDNIGAQILRAFGQGK